MIKRETEKILKYKDLKTYIQHMCDLKTRVIPVTTGATDTLSESFRQYLSSISGKHDVHKIHKTATLGTAHILRKVLM